MRTALYAAAFCTAFATPALAADRFDALVVKHDPIAKTIILSDKSVVTYAGSKVELPAGLKAGDKVQVQFTGTEGDMSTILAINVLPQQ